MRLQSKSFALEVAALSAALLVVAFGFTDAALASGPATAPSSGPNLLKNGAFSAGKPIGDGCGDVGNGLTIADWTPGPNLVQACGYQYSMTPPGVQQYVSLALNGPGSVTQTIATIPGTTYLVRWDGAAYPTGEPVVKVMQVLWNGKVVASHSYSGAGETTSKVNWSTNKVVVTATSTSSTLEFADATPANMSGASYLAAASMAGLANLFLPATARLAPTGKLTAIIHNGVDEPFTLPGLTVRLYGSYKTSSYAPATKHLLATAPVVKGQAVLHLKLPSSLKGQTIVAHADLTGPNYIATMKPVTIKVTTNVLNQRRSHYAAAPMPAVSSSRDTRFKEHTVQGNRFKGTVQTVAALSETRECC